jgi:hypothetical protein
MYSTKSSTTCPPHQATLERPRYFARQLVTPAELNLESQYFVDRMRRHNRMLHGWGVVCGAQVCRVPTADGTAGEPWKVRIAPGFLIDGHGNEVEIGADRIVDLRSTGVSVGCGDPPGELSDPWCNDVPVDREPGRLWLAVCHRDCLVRPVRTQPTGCECDETPCEYSRWQDGYDVRLLPECPESHQGPPPDPRAFLQRFRGRLPACPECPEDPCVVLAVVDFDDDGTILAIDNCSCRRMVVSIAEFWWRCGGGRVVINQVRVAGKAAVYPGATDVKVIAKGDNLHADADADLGEGVVITSKEAPSTGGSMTLLADIDESAALGDRMLTVTGADCSTASYPRALTIDAPRAEKHR